MHSRRAHGSTNQRRAREAASLASDVLRAERLRVRLRQWASVCGRAGSDWLGAGPTHVPQRRWEEKKLVGFGSRAASEAQITNASGRLSLPTRSCVSVGADFASPPPTARPPTPPPRPCRYFCASLQRSGAESANAERKSRGRLLSAGADSLDQRDVHVSVHKSEIGTFLRVPRHALKPAVERANPQPQPRADVTVEQRSAAATILTKV